MFSLVLKLEGHTAELSNCLLNFDQTIIATSSIDATARLWDIRGVRTSHVIDGHTDEVLDICFNYTGNLLATSSNDCTCKIWDIKSDFHLISTMLGHSDEVSRVRSSRVRTQSSFFTFIFSIFHSSAKVRFNPIGNLVLTASADKTARIWHTETGLCSQILSGHTDEVISCAFNYPGIWKKSTFNSYEKIYLQFLSIKMCILR